MGTAGNLRKYPPYKNAIDAIRERVEKESYGFTLSHGELLELLELKEPGTVEEYKRYSLKLLDAMESVKEELLEEHNICLFNIRGEGYQVLHPNDQATIAFRKAMKQGRKQVLKARKLITHIDTGLLNMEVAKDRLRSLARVAFVETAFNKRKLLTCRKDT